MKKHIIAFLASVLTALPVMAQVNKEIQCSDQMTWIASTFPCRQMKSAV